MPRSSTTTMATMSRPSFTANSRSPTRRRGRASRSVAHPPRPSQQVRASGTDWDDLAGSGTILSSIPRLKRRNIAGILLLPATPDVVEGFVAAAQAAPEELSTIANVMPAPPMPFVPEEHHSQMVVIGVMAYAGASEAGQQALAPFRARPPPIADLVRPMPYAEIYQPEPP